MIENTITTTENLVQDNSSIECVSSETNPTTTIPNDGLIFGQKHNDIDCALCPTAKRACDRAWVTAKQIENWSKMSKTTLWRRLNKLEEVGRICSVSDMIHCKMPHEQGGSTPTTLYNLNVLNQLAMVCIGNEKLNEVSCKFSDILSEVETAGSYSILLDHRFEYDYKRKEAMDSTSNRLKWSFQSGSGITNKPLHNRRNTMQNTMLDSTTSCIPSTEIRVYKDYLEAPPISGVYVFEVEKGLVKCGMSGNVEKRFIQLVDIKKHREAPSCGRAAILPVDSGRLKRAEEAFFALLSGNVDGTELFKIPFERALKALRSLYENNPPSMFHLTDEEKAEKELRKQKSEESLKNALRPWDIALIRDRYANDRVVAELGVSKIFSLCLKAFPLSVEEGFASFMAEYRHGLDLMSRLLSPEVWEEDAGRLYLDDVTAGRIGVLALRLHGVTSSYKDVLKSSIHPRMVVYHAANLVAILEDIKNLYSELIEVAEKSEEKYPELIFKEARDRAGYFIRYFIDLFVVTCSYPGQDVSWFRDELQSVYERLHELIKEDEMREMMS